MIRVFRNIQKLAAENKVSAFLCYAIGEILLVNYATFLQKNTLPARTHKHEFN